MDGSRDNLESGPFLQNGGFEALWGIGISVGPNKLWAKTPISSHLYLPSVTLSENLRGSKCNVVFGTPQTSILPRSYSRRLTRYQINLVASHGSKSNIK
jgi:hypothetical protein